MCHNSCLEFGQACLQPADVAQKNVLEVGSYNVNGSLRPYVLALGPAAYIGVDIQPGPGVDMLCDISDLINRFGVNSFDFVICTEVLEHVMDWRTAIVNLKRVVKPSGVLLVTTRSLGFPYHSYPHDFWRYEVVDIQNIFSDFGIEALLSDYELPGVFLKARKPLQFAENSLHGYPLHSMITGGRTP